MLYPLSYRGNKVRYSLPAGRQVSTELRARYLTVIAYFCTAVNGKLLTFGFNEPRMLYFDYSILLNIESTNMGKIIGVVGVVLVAGALLFWKFAGTEEDDKMMATPESKGTTGMEPKKDTMMTGEKTLSYKTSYTNPSGSDEVGFNVMVDANGVVTGVTVDVLAVNGISKNRQTAFATDLPQAINGKKLMDLNAIDRVGGSSLTTGAFNAALPALKAQL